MVLGANAIILIEFPPNLHIILKPPTKCFKGSRLQLLISCMSPYNWSSYSMLLKLLIKRWTGNTPSPCSTCTGSGCCISNSFFQRFIIKTKDHLPLPLSFSFPQCPCAAFLCLFFFLMQPSCACGFFFCFKCLSLYSPALSFSFLGPVLARSPLEMKLYCSASGVVEYQ